MTAHEFVLIPKHIYIGEKPHAAHVLLDNSIKHKKPQLSYLNHLRPPNATTTNPSVIPTPESVSQQKTIKENKLSFSLKMKEMN